jgi:DNA-binding CsgD family transcriptional regulator
MAAPSVNRPSVVTTPTQARPAAGYLVSRLDPRIRLTVRAVDIVYRVSRGARPQELARSLGLAPDTVYKDLGTLRNRMNARTPADLVRRAILHGFIDP